MPTRRSHVCTRTPAVGSYSRDGVAPATSWHVVVFPHSFGPTTTIFTTSVMWIRGRASRGGGAARRVAVDARRRPSFFLEQIFSSPEESV
jgi:hypothetical protein